MTDQSQTKPAKVTAPETIVLPLRKPITVHGDAGPKELKSLTLKMPSGRLVRRLGEPFTTKNESDGAGGVRFEFRVNPALASEYLAEMSGVEADLLDQMHARDVLDAFDAIVKMLRPIEG
jgi:hypothetical protein